MAFIVPLLPAVRAQTTRLTCGRCFQGPRPLSMQIATTASQPIPARGHEFVRPPADSLHPSGPLSDSDLDFFFRNGYVVVPGLLSGQLLGDALAASKVLDDEKIAVVNAGYNRVTFNAWDHAPVLRKIVTSSPLSQAVAQILPASKSPRSRVALKDAYFKMRGTKPVCNFHVDDLFFWPCPADQPGPGINAWIALDDVTDDGGGLTVAPGSYTEEYLDCRDAINSVSSLQVTCSIQNSHPDGLARLEGIAVSPTLRRGDAILHTRWLFHRGNPYMEESKAAKGPGIRRYSVRYMPGEAITEPRNLANGIITIGDRVALCDADPEKYPSIKLE